MSGIRDFIKTAEGIEELAYILSMPVASVEQVAQRMNDENLNNPERIIDEMD